MCVKGALYWIHSQNSTLVLWPIHHVTYKNRLPLLAAYTATQNIVPRVEHEINVSIKYLLDALLVILHWVRPHRPWCAFLPLGKSNIDFYYTFKWTIDDNQLSISGNVPVATLEEKGWKFAVLRTTLIFHLTKEIDESYSVCGQVALWLIILWTDGAVVIFLGTGGAVVNLSVDRCRCG